MRTVFQSYALFPHMTVEGNVAFPLQMAKVPAADMPAKIAEALEDVRLTGFGKRMPHDGKTVGQLKVRGNWVISGYCKGEGGKVMDDDGWFAYRAMESVTMATAIVRAGGEPAALAADRQAMRLLWDAVRQGVAALRAAGVRGLSPAGVVGYHPLAGAYWRSQTAGGNLLVGDRERPEGHTRCGVGQHVAPRRRRARVVLGPGDQGQLERQRPFQRPNEGQGGDRGRPGRGDGPGECPRVDTFCPPHRGDHPCCVGVRARVAAPWQEGKFQGLYCRPGRAKELAP